MLIWIVFFSKFSILKLIESNSIIKEKKAELEELRKQKTKLIKESDQLKNADLKVIEKKARELGMAKEGEKIIRIKKQELQNE